MTNPALVLRRAGRSIHSLHRLGLLAPMAGLAAVGGSMAAMSAVAWAHPELAALTPEGGVCNPLAGDFGCGHGFGCACHMLPPPGQPLD